MADQKNNTALTELLPQCMSTTEPMFSMLDRLCTQMMEAFVQGV